MTGSIGCGRVSRDLQTMEAITIGRGLQIAFFAIALCSAGGGQAYSENNQFSCSGDDIEPVGLAKSPIAAQLSFVSPKRISFDLGKGSVKATITSNNKIALRFRTADFDGEFFKYTNDLFLIYHSGHLGKLLCATK
jgi:hypothetical protein